MKRRAYQASDWQQVVDLLYASRAQGGINRYPTIWRLGNLMTARVWEPGRDVQLWERSAEQLIGFAVLTRRQPTERFLGLERIVAPEAQAELRDEQLHWADERARIIAAELDAAVVLGVNLLERFTTDDLRLLEASGYTHSPENVNLYMTRSLTGSLETIDLPSGFTLAPLLAGEIDVYERLYSFTAMTHDHRLELLRSPDYQHLVVKAPDGQFVAYIECAIDRHEWGQNERRIGWIDYIGTATAFQRCGLAKAMLAAGFGWLKEAGASEARLVTGNDNLAAQRLYRSGGMVMAEQEPIYLKNIPNSNRNIAG